MQPIISVERLSKQYTLGGPAGYDTLRDMATRWGRSAWSRLRRMLGRGATDPMPATAASEAETLWALRDVSFEVPAGQLVGVIGGNGAGKSTLLKILSRVVEPTSGRVAVRGRLASLLEVGTGFHGELTGRENVFLNGSILGLSRRDILRRFDDIVSFAEVEKFIDTPVKRYSSGMYVRLAFAVAAHLEPDVLILDEVLAVGDAAFQQKCMERVGAITRSGRTAILVSHNMAAVANLCQSAVWLERGNVRDVGAARPLVDRYLANQSQAVPRGLDFADERRVHGYGRQARLTRMEWLSSLPAESGAPLHLRLHIQALAPTSDLSGGVGVCTLDGTRLLTLDSDFDGERPRLAAGETTTLDVRLPALPVSPGNYTLDVGIRSGTRVCLDYFAFAVRFEVVPGATTPDFVRHATNTGVRLPAKWAWGGALASTKCSMQSAD